MLEAINHANHSVGSANCIPSIYKKSPMSGQQVFEEDFGNWGGRYSLPLLIGFRLFKEEGMASDRKETTMLVKWPSTRNRFGGSALSGV